MSDYTDSYDVTHEADMDHDNKWMADEIVRLSAENSRYREALEDIASSVADEAYNQIDVSGQWMLDRARRALVSTEQTCSQDGNKDIRQYASKSEEWRIQHQCRHTGDTRTEGGMTFCDKCGVELL